MSIGLADTLPAPRKPLAARALARYIAQGREVLYDTARPLRLWRKYTDADKQPTDEQQRAVLGKLVADGREELRHYAEGLESGRLTLERWYRLTRNDVIARHAAAALATAGTTRLGVAEREALRSRINKQLAYLDNFRNEIRTGEQPLGDGSSNRATYYADATWGTGMNAVLLRAQQAGVTLARRVLGVADHCNQCLYEASRSWVPIMDVLPIGEAECLMLCHCWVEIASSAIIKQPGGVIPVGPLAIPAIALSTTAV